ncbi:MAG: hypothetical protein M1309_01960 [Actinobacteria bacterium]|nr:hypothetical protein [Actinomycetota bacterium]
MITIIVEKFKVFKYGKEYHCESVVVGHINWHRDGTYEVFSDSADIKKFIEEAVSYKIAKGVPNFSSQVRGPRIIEYMNILKPTDPRFPSCLAGRLSESHIKMGDYQMMAMLEEKFYKHRKSWTKVNENTYRICYK